MSDDEEPGFTFHDHIPRDRACYVATDHLLGRVRMDGRFITEGVVRDLIANGELKGNRPGKGGWVFEDTYDGVALRLICDLGADLEPRAVTGISLIEDRQQAVDSDRWGKHKVQQVELRTALAEANNGVDKRTMEKLECVRPIDVRDHRVITALNWQNVKCLDCDLETRAKSRLAGTPCD